jgi:hypothetical protein
MTMTATATSKLPMNDRPVILDPDLARAVDALLEPFNGEPLKRAQSAVRKVASSAISVPYSGLVDAYRDAIRQAVGPREYDAKSGVSEE